MIEVTDEMVQTFIMGAGWPPPPWKPGEDIRAGLSATLNAGTPEQLRELAGELEREADHREGLDGSEVW